MVMVMSEYQVVFLDETKKLYHDETDDPIMETDDLSVAISAAVYMFDSTGSETAVWQPRTQGYRAYFKIKTIPDRDTSGRFIKAIPSEA